MSIEHSGLDFKELKTLSVNVQMVHLDLIHNLPLTKDDMKSKRRFIDEHSTQQ